MSAPIQRLHYFDQQFLRAGDFTAEQEYHRQMLREHNRALHTVGVASGLTLAAAGTAVTVSPGTAIDADGEEIVLVEPKTIDLEDEEPGKPVFVTVAYRARQTDPSDETGVSDYTRSTDDPLIGKSVALPADQTRTLILGQATRTGTQVTSITGLGRRRSSVPEAAELRTEIASQINTRVAKAGDTISGALTVQGALNAGSATVGGALAVSGALSAAGGATAAGVVIGRDAGGAVDYPFEYETVGVAAPNYNLRLQSPNAIVFHTGGAARAIIDSSGAFNINGDAGASVRLLVGAGANGQIKVRHIEGKAAPSDANDSLYLNWMSRLPVVVGGLLEWGGDASPSGYVRLGALQIAWGRRQTGLSMQYIELETPFPAPFAQVPYVVTSMDDPGFGLSTPLSTVGAYNVRTNAVTIIIKSDRAVGGATVNCTYIAIGTWR